jgi:RNA polymerase sigma factor (sigma-70 family)
MNNNPGNEFANLVQENRGILFKVCNAYCRNKADIDDLAQEMVYQLWKSYPTYKPEYKFTTWMYRVVLNVAISYYRKRKKSGATIALDDHLVDIADTDPQPAETAQRVALLQQFISELKELDRAVMILYLEEKSYKEIADIIGISETNIATKISRIKNRLKERFTPYNQ